MHVLEQLDRQEQLGERVVQRRHDTDVRALELGGDGLEGDRLGGHVDAVRGKLAGERGETFAVLARAADPQRHTAAGIVERGDRPDQALDAEAWGETAVVEHSDRVAAQVGASVRAEGRRPARRASS